MKNLIDNDDFIDRFLTAVTLVTILLVLLLGIPLHAQLPETGPLSIKSAAGAGRSISQQVDGNETGNKSLSTLSTTAGFSAPHSMLEFRGWPNEVSATINVGATAAYSGTLQIYYSTDGVNYAPLGSAFSGETCSPREIITRPSGSKTVYIKIFHSGENDFVHFYFNSASGACISNVSAACSATLADISLNPNWYFNVQVSAGNVVRCSAPPPTAPSTVFASLSGSDVSLSWSGASGDITTYRIERRTNGGSYSFLNNDAASPYTDNTVSTGNEYQYRVRAEGPGGNSSYTESNTVNTTTPPGLPRNVTATPTSGKITVSWLVPSSGGSPANYTIERSVNFGSFGAWRSTLDASTSIDDTMVLPGNYYNYRVRANNAGGSSGWVESGDVCYQGPCI